MSRDRIVLAGGPSAASEAAGRRAVALARRTGLLVELVEFVERGADERTVRLAQAELDLRVAIMRGRGVRCVGTLLVGTPAADMVQVQRT